MVLVGDDVVDGVEAQTGSLSRFLRGEERFEDPVLDGRGNLRPVVLDFHHDALVLEPCAHDDPAVFDVRLVDRICGVVDQVRPHLVEAAAMSGDPGEIGVEGADDCDAGRLRFQDEQCVVNAPRHVDVLHRGLIEIGVRLESGDELAEPFRSFRDLGHEIIHFGPCSESLHDKFGNGGFDLCQIGCCVAGIHEYRRYAPCIGDGELIEDGFEVILDPGSFDRTEHLSSPGRYRELGVRGEGGIGRRSPFNRCREERRSPCHRCSRVVHFVGEACGEHTDLGHALGLAKSGLLLPPAGDEHVEECVYGTHV